ncbi:MAG: tol-pal system protein YbgF, partial [Candidatus Wenzhouxiangella sp. M2_3B_020]
MLADRLRLLTVLVVVAVAPSAAAQNDNMSSRMILELQQMREEVRELRGMVEAQAQEIENLKRRQRDQYLDLDRRLSELRGQPVPTGSAEPQPGREAIADARQQPTPPPAESDEETAAASPEIAAPTSQLPEVREPSDEQPEVATLAEPDDGPVRQLEEPDEAEQEAYDRAFRALRETRYADAAEGFDRFLRDHPRSAYAPNALYWLGEVYYVTRDFQTALEQFQRLQETYPDSGKKPDALLKIGFSHYELGNWERARAALEQVIAEYPGTNYSRLAENRLRTMRLEGN